MSRIKSIPIRTAEEEIQSITHVVGERVEMVVGTGKFVNVLDKRKKVIGTRFEFDSDQKFERHVIRDVDYIELMSANPRWMPSKPAGQFRVEDLWPAVDCRRKNTPLSDEIA